MDVEELKDKEDMITIPLEEYNQLKKAAYMAQCLDNAGVDNWGGCENAYEQYLEEYPEDA